VKVGDLVMYKVRHKDELKYSSIGIIVEIIQAAEVATVKWSSNGRSDFMTCSLCKLEVINGN